MADETSVEQFARLAPQLIIEAAEYAAKGERDPDTEAAIRRLHVLSMALQSALSSLMMQQRNT
jgi:hypothetical protein